jgi:hypothetical protein
MDFAKQDPAVMVIPSYQWMVMLTQLKTAVRNDYLITVT